ncbi:hypothetical protein Tco_1474713 [Tanacetum coccineum]
MLAAGLILLKTSFSSPTLKVIFLLKTSILEWALDKNGHPRIKETSSSSASESHLLCLSSQSSQLKFISRPRKGTVSDNMLLCCVPDTAYGPHPIRPPWFLIAASVEVRISLIMFEFSSCLLADSAMNLVSDSSRLGLRSGYEEFPLFRW